MDILFEHRTLFGILILVIGLFVWKGVSRILKLIAVAALILYLVLKYFYGFLG